MHGRWRRRQVSQGASQGLKESFACFDCPGRMLGVMTVLTSLILRVRHALLHPKSALVRAYEGQRKFQEPPWELISTLLRPNAIILEAGAADGADTVRLAALNNGNVQVIALEPVPIAFERLRLTTAPLDNVQVMPYALGKESARVGMWQSGGSGGSDSSSLLAPADHGEFFSDVTFDSRIWVQACTIDDLLRRLSIPMADFMWLDLQGSELDVLTASPESRSSVTAIYMEVSRYRLYSGAPTYRKVLDRMKSWGFCAIHERVGAISGNVLFQRK